MENNTNQRQGVAGQGTRVLAILGFIAILGVGMWGSVQIARAVPNAFSAIAAAIVSITSIFVPADEIITVTTPSLSVESGKEVTLSWEHAEKSVAGSYTFRYNCADGVYFTSPAVNGSQQTIYCNVPFNFVNAGDSIVITPVSEKNRFIDIEVFVDFTPNGASTATVTGGTVLTVVNEKVSSSPTTSNPTTPVTPTTPTTPTTPSTPTQPSTPTAGNPSTSVHVLGNVPVGSNPNGYVDLTARVIEVGIVDKTTGVFTASSTPSRIPFGARVAIRFAVENIGTKRAPQFSFNAVLPTLPSHIFSSPTIQQELNPGDRIEFTVGFDSFVDADSGEITLNIDPSGRIMEPNKENNIVKYTINVRR